MQLTTQATETFLRKLAAASEAELQACAKELKATAMDPGQTIAVSETAKDLAAVVRKRSRAGFGK